MVQPKRLVFVAAMIVMGAVLCASPRNADAQHARATGPTPPRLSFIDGDVSFWRPGADDWTPAQVNTALAAGDNLYAPEGANLELEIGARAFVRAGSDTQIGIDSLEVGYLQLEVTSGHAALDLKDVPPGQQIEIDTPSGAFTVERPGYYRVDVGDDATTFTTHRGGLATAIPAGGDGTDIRADEQVVLEGTETAKVSVNAAPAADEWDRWNDDRTGRRAERPRGAEYVPPVVAGVDDLDAYGDWRDEPQYGHVWIPRDVAPDWAPYSTGRWVWDPYYEWTWVDDAAWGWAPYHYGRWCRVGDAWGWAPGPVVAAPVYAPALVAFFGSPGGVSVSVGVGAPVVSWVALGFGEPVLPWWGPPGFVGRPYWGGWGGRHVVNNVVVNNTTIVNVQNINRFQNAEVRNAVIGVDREHFGRGRVDHVRMAPDQARGLQVVRGQIGVKPVATSLVAREGRGRRPPEQRQNRRVVATRPPQNVAPRLRAAGLEPARVPHPVEAPRIVAPGARRGRERVDSTGGPNGKGGPAMPAAGAPNVGRGANEPPPPPGRPDRGTGRERGRGNDRGGNEAPQPGQAGGNIRDRGNEHPGRPAAPVPPAVEERGNPRNRDRGTERPAAPAPPAVEEHNTRSRDQGKARPGRPEVPPPPAIQERGNTRHGDRATERPGRPEVPPPPAIEEHGNTKTRDRNESRGRPDVPPPPAIEEHGNTKNRDRGRPEMPAAPPAQERVKERGAERPPREMPARPQAADNPEKTNNRGDGGSAPRMDRVERQQERQTERAARPRPEHAAPPRTEHGAPPPPPDHHDKGAHNPKDAGDRP